MNEDEDRRIVRKAAAYDMLMRNLGTASNPWGGDPEQVRWALAVLDDEEPDTGGDPGVGTRKSAPPTAAGGRGVRDDQAPGGGHPEPV